MINFHNQTTWRGIVLIAILALTAILILEGIQLGGNTRFYMTWVSCEHKPVATATSKQDNSSVVYYYEPSSMPGVHVSSNYFCTPLEAEQAGYSASPTEYSFPHLQRGA